MATQLVSVKIDAAERPLKAMSDERCNLLDICRDLPFETLSRKVPMMARSVRAIRNRSG